MGMENDFAKLRRSAQEEAKSLAARFMEKNTDVAVAATLERNGVYVEYVSDHDHLYMTIGPPRAGMAFVGDHAVLLADPETLELLAIEILDFSKAVATDTLRTLEPLFSFVQLQPVVHVPPRRTEDKSAAFPHAVAQGVQRVLSPASD